MLGGKNVAGVLGELVLKAVKLFGCGVGLLRSFVTCIYAGLVEFLGVVVRNAFVLNVFRQNALMFRDLLVLGISPQPIRALSS